MTTVDDTNMEVFDGSDWRTYTNAHGGWYGGTYHESCDDRDDLTVSFKGTGIRVYGAKRPTYGYYYAELDGQNRRYFNAHSTKDEIPALLFEATGLNNVDHSLWMMNQQNYGGQRSRSCWGIDYMVISEGSDVPTGATSAPSEQASSEPAQSSQPSLDPSQSSPPAESTPSPSASVAQPSVTDTEVGNPVSSSSTPENLTVPNLSNYTQAPSANEVGAPNTTWGTGTLTAVTGQAGVYSGQPLPVFTGQAINAIGAGPPNLKQEAFVTGVMAGVSSATSHSTELPGAAVWLLVLGTILLRGIRGM